MAIGIVAATRIISELMREVLPQPILRINNTTRPTINRISVVAHREPIIVEGNNGIISNNNRLDKMLQLRHNNRIAADNRCRHLFNSSLLQSVSAKKENRKHKTKDTIGLCQLVLDQALVQPKKCR